MLYHEYIATILLITSLSELVHSKGTLRSDCKSDNDCKVHYSVCNPTTKRCVCHNSTNTHACICVKRELYIELGQPCTGSRQCAVAYSTCKNNVCSCQAGFATIDGLCKSSRNYCPYFRKSGRRGLLSQKLCVQNSDDKIIDGRPIGNCSNNEYCFLHDGVRRPGHSKVGVCCLKPKYEGDEIIRVCPHSVKDPLDRSCKNDSSSNMCSEKTHHCIMDQGRGICCPRPCPSFGNRSHFSLDGRCYADLLHGEYCTHDFECPTGAKCKISEHNNKDKTCQCEHGSSDGRHCNQPVATVEDSNVPPKPNCSKGEVYSKCENHNDCTAHYSICNEKTKRCECHNSTQRHGCTCQKRALYVELGQKCTDSHQCAIAYSSCKNHVCTCKAGFKAMDGFCKAAGNFCPYFRNTPQNQLTSNKLCVRNFEQETTFNARPPGNCSETEYCLIHDGVRTFQHQSVGFCCPRPYHQDDQTIFVCPHGIDDPQRRFCEENFYWYENPNACPRETHRCVFYEEKGKCCLRPCASFEYRNHFSLDGRCYPEAFHGEYCTVDIQCTYEAKCKASDDNKKDKVCLCEHGSSDGRYCDPPPTEIGEPFVSPEYACSKGEVNSECENHNDCIVQYSICNSATKRCECHNSTEKHGCLCYQKELYAELGHYCTDSHQCAIAYSSCQNRICHCQTGFIAIDGLCRAPGNFCPHVQNSDQNQFTSEKLCIDNSNSTSFDVHQAGDCSAKEYCFMHQGMRTRIHHRIGVCCPKPTRPDDLTMLVCPHGVNDLQHRSCKVPHGNPDACPWQTHHCTFFKEKSICCLKPCQSFGLRNHFSLDGRCYAEVENGEFCTHDIQCNLYASCKASPDSLKDKTCQCDHGAVNGGGCKAPLEAAGNNRN